MATGQRRIGIVGYGHIGSYVYQQLARRPELGIEVAFVHDMRADRLAQLPQALVLEDIEDYASRNVDMVCEFAHPDVSRQYGEMFLSGTDYMPLSATVFADAAIEEGLKEAAEELGVPELPDSLPGLPGAGGNLPKMLRNAWPGDRTYWKFAHKGACQDLFFHTKLNRTPAFVQAISKVADKYDYSIDEIGFYAQPLEYARACHFECNLYYNPDDAEAVEKTRSLFKGLGT